MRQHERTHPDNAEQDWLSALLDGEIDAAEGERALRRLSRDRTLMQRWAEYCLIGDALRGEALAQPGLERRLRNALAAEPTVLAPIKRHRHHRQYTRAVAWTAAAAAVAVVTWTIWTALPHHTAPAQMATQPDAVVMQARYITPYLDAHQDFSQGVVAQPEMHFTQVTLVGLEGGR